ncbi:MAG: hypothetical protein H6817_10365 [Phycisphaerales bacterium]|nr:hypothetical protein [Phycisphaerales bacterium]
MRRNSLPIIDLVGGSVTCGVVALGVWCTFFHLSTTSQHLTTVRSQLADMHKSVIAGEEALREKKRERDALERDIAERGALPERSPVESDLREIARMAKAEGIDLTQVTPVQGAEYPGLLELRYAINARADYDALLAFLRRFKDSTLWADIIRLDIGGRRGDPSSEESVQPTALVMSLFATHDDEKTTAQ